MIDLGHKHTEHQDRDQDVEHNGCINQDRHLNTDSHREEEYSVFDNQKTYHVSEDS